MSSQRLWRGTRVLRIGLIGAIAVAALVWPAAWILDGRAQSLQLIHPFDEATVGVNRFAYEDEPTGAEDDVLRIYGVPLGKPERVLFVDQADIIRPRENPNLVLLKKAEDENPLKIQTVYFFARLASIGACLGAGALLLLLAIVRRRHAGTKSGAGVRPRRCDSREGDGH